jgi:hypothetical protein
MSLLPFFEWLGNTEWSVALHESLYVWRIVSTVHVVTLFLFVGTASVLDLRLMGLAWRRVPVTEVMARLLPWIIGGFLVMISSGSLLFFANPAPRYQNLFFRAKMLMLASAGLNALVFQRTVYRRVAEWDLSPVPPRAARVAGGLALVLWAGLITMGRMIPYQLYWFDCHSRPPHRILNVLSGCPPDSR